MTLLRLTGPVHISPDCDNLYDYLANLLIAAAIKAVKERNVFHLALSSGSTPEPFYVRLVTDPRFRILPWQFTHIWMVDERCVPEEDERSNYRMIRESLLDHVPVGTRHRHPMSILPNDPASTYEHQLQNVIKSHELTPRLDFVLLGMGDDAHTASLFPHSPALDEMSRLVAINQGPKVTPPDRLTMTFALLNAARYVAVLVTGRKKTAALCQIEQQLHTSGPDRHRFPITGIDPASAGGGQLFWFLDAEAAGSTN